MTLSRFPYTLALVGGTPSRRPRFDRIRAAPFAAAGALLLASAARAQEVPSEFYNPKAGTEYNLLLVRVGSGFPKGGLGGKSGLALGVELVMQRHPRWGYGVDIAHFVFNRRSKASAGAAEPNDQVRRDASVLMTGRWVALPKAALSPVLTAGLGMHYFDAAFRRADAPDRIFRSFGYKAAGMLGIDVTGRRRDSWAWTVAARWHLLPEPREFRKDYSRAPGQALSLTAAVGIDF